MRGLTNRALAWLADRFTADDTKHLATFKKPTNTGAGEVAYYQHGKIVVFSGTVQLTGNVSSGAILFDDMPTVSSTIMAFRVNNSSTGNMYDFYVNGTTIRNVGSCPAGWYRLSGAYVTT